MKPSLKAALLIMTVAIPGTGFADSETPRLFALRPGTTPDGPGVETAWRVKVDSELVRDGQTSLHLDMPDGLEFEATRMSLTRRPGGSVTWVGHLAEERHSRVILSMTDGVLSGWIQSRFGEYELRPLRGGDHVISRIDRNLLAGCQTASTFEIDTDPAPLPQIPFRVAADGAGRLDVLVVYTPESVAEAGSVALVRSRISLMRDMANEAFAASRMDARLNVVHIATAGFRDSGDFYTDLLNLYESPRVRNLRENHLADLVVLIAGTNPVWCGLAPIQSPISPDFAPFAISVVAFSCLDAFAHEIGHNLGFEHDPPNANNPPNHASRPWAFGHFVSNDFRTVMAYPNPCGNCERILNFSNPRVDHDGKPTGIADQRDNARVGNQSAPVVANFRLSGVLFEDNFEGTNFSAWTTARSGLSLVSPGLDGSGQALEVSLAGTTARRYLAHKVPTPGPAVDVEFLLNMNGADLGDGEIALLEFFGQGQSHLALTARHNGGAYLLTLYAKANGGAYVEIASTAARAFTTERIGVIWRAATAPETADGYVRLVKNGGPRGTVDDFANDTRSVREVRVGTPGGSVGAAVGDTFLIDAYLAKAPPE
jgi:hypothetical protein